MVVSTDNFALYTYDLKNNSVIKTFNLYDLYQSEYEKLKVLEDLKNNYENIQVPHWFALRKKMNLKKFGSLSLSDYESFMYSLKNFDGKGEFIIDVIYYDKNIAFWKRYGFDDHKKSKTSQNVYHISHLNGVKYSSLIRKLKHESSFIVVITNKKIVMLNYDNLHNITTLKECNSFQLDDKYITCVDFLCTHNKVAVACTDGHIRMWNYKTEIIDKNASFKAHSKAITKLLCVYERDVVHNMPKILSCGMDGNLSLWNGKNDILKLKNIHNGSGIIDMCYMNEIDTIITLGDNKSIALTKMGKREVYKTVNIIRDMNFKLNLRNVSYTNVLNHRNNTNIILMAQTSNFCKVGISFKKETFANYRIMEDTKIEKKNLKSLKKVKLLQMKSDLIQSDIIYISTQSSIRIYQFQNPKKPCIVQNVIRKSDFGKNYRRFLYYVKEGKLFERFINDEKEKLSPETKRVDFEFTPDVSLLMSPYNGDYVTIFQKSIQNIVVYHTQSWDKIYSKQNVLDVCWDMREEKMAILESSDNRTRILIMNNFKVEKTIDKNDIIKIFGGVYMGVSTSNNKMTFYDWKSGKEMVELKELGENENNFISSPDNVMWDVSSNNFALIYPKALAIFGYTNGMKGKSGSFYLQAFVRKEVRSALWFNGSLFIVTPMDMRCLLVNLKGEVDEVIIGTFNVEEFECFSTKRKDNVVGGDVYAPVPSPMLKRHDLAIGTIIGEKMYCMNAKGDFFSFTIASQVMKFKMLAQSGMIKEALKWLDFIPNELHDDLGSFLIERGYFESVLSVRTLSLQWKLKLFMKHEKIIESFKIISVLEEHQRDEYSKEDISKLYLDLAFCIERKKNKNVDEIGILEKCYNYAVKIDKSKFKNLISFLAKEKKMEEIEKLKNFFLRMLQTGKLKGNSEKENGYKEILVFISILLGDSEICKMESLKSEIIFMNPLKEKEALKQKYPNFVSFEIEKM